MLAGPLWPISMKQIILIIFSFFVYSCSSNQEPIYHLFEHSTQYPDYSEYEYLISHGFETNTFEDTLYLVNSQENIQIRFDLDDNEDILVKKTIVHLNKFDTLIAENAIRSRFNGHKQNDWEKLNDSTYSVFVNYKQDIYKIYLKYRDKPFLESRFDFFHRIIK